MATVAPLREFALLDICDFYSGKAHEQHIVENGKFKVINSKFVSTEGEVYKTSSESFLTAKKNDITMVMSDLPNGRALAKCFFVDENDKYAVNQRVCILRAKFFDPKYLFYVLNRHEYFLSFNDGVSQTHLLNHVFEKCKILISDDVKEQKEIAEALSDIDDLIIKSKELLDKEQKFLDGLLLKIFSGSIKFGDKIIDWKTTSFKEVSVIDWGNTNLTKKAYVDGGKYLAVSATGIDGFIDRYEHEAFVPVISAIGALCGKMLLPRNKFVAIKNTITVTPKKGVAEGRFLFYLLRYSELPIRGGAQPFISKGDIERFEALMPFGGELEYQEQVLIADFLDTFEQEISDLKTELQKYEWLKQGMMNDLLTGKVRLV